MSDLIERQAVLDAMYALCNTDETLKENPWRDNPHIDAITDAIEDLPPVTPQQKTGRWIKRESGIVLFECSVCKDGYIDQPTCMGKPMFKYCPVCGAKMAESEE